MNSFPWAYVTKRLRQYKKNLRIEEVYDKYLRLIFSAEVRIGITLFKF